MDHTDLTNLLKDWPYEPGRINARRFTGRDEREKLQIRVDLGVIQMELEGRPDGRRPDPFESLLEMQLDRMERYTRESGTPAGFVVSSDECRALREEAIQYYHRYVGLFALGDYDGVVRDTDRNLRVFDLCRDWGESPADRKMLEQFRPAVITTKTRAAAENAVAVGEPKQALAMLEQGIQTLRDLFDEAGQAEMLERSNEYQLLHGMRDALVPKLPASQRAELEERLRAALDAENYELAAILRDEMRLLND